MKPNTDEQIHQRAAKILIAPRSYPIAVLAVTLCAPLFAPTLFAEDESSDAFSPYVDAAGNISLPTNFDTEFVHLGTIAVATENDHPVDQMHSTYTRPEDVKAFQKNGQFLDGAVLVKSVRGTTHEELTTGDASYADDIKVWFVMIKGAQDNKLPNFEYCF